jgi:tubby and related proteins
MSEPENLIVHVVARPPEGSKNLGHATEPGTWAGPRDAMGLVVFAYAVKLIIPKHIALKSVYFAKQLEGPWKGMSSVEVPLKNTRGVDAFAACCVHGLSTKQFFDEMLTSYNQFNIYAAAGMLKLENLQVYCENYIEKSMTTERFLAAMRHGAKYERRNMLKICYRWFKHRGALDEDDAKAAEEENLPTDRAMAKAAGIVDDTKLTFSKLNMEVYTHLRRANISIFKDLADEEHREKSNIFVPPKPTASNQVTECKEYSGADILEKVKRAKGFHGLMRTYVKRKRRAGEDKKSTVYVVHHEASGDVIVAASCNDGKTFILSSDENDFSLTSPSYLGKVRPNFAGTVFKCIDYGIIPKVCPDGIPQYCKAVEHAAIVYETNVLGRVPNAMTVVLPTTNADSASADGKQEYTPPHHDCAITEKLADHYKKVSDCRVRILKTRKPIWSDDVEAWTMDFHGRVKLASKKNFQLIDVGKGGGTSDEETLMLFGKVTKDIFSLDYKAPMTVIQALSVALTSFADKLMVT